MIQDFFQVFFMTLVSDIDNMLILGAIFRRHTYMEITFLAAILLTVTRSIYVVLVESLSNVPFFHLLMGLVLLVISFKLVTRSISGSNLHLPSRYMRRSPYLKAKVLLTLAATDFLICWDSVLIISNISDQMAVISLGIVCSLLISLYFLRLIIKLAVVFAWINIIAGGFIAQNAIIGMAKDPWMAGCIDYMDNLVPSVNIVNTAANGTVIIIVVVGLVSYIKHHRIILHKKF